MVNQLSYTRAQAIKLLFDIKLTEHKRFKDKLTTLECKDVDEHKSALNLVREESTGAIGSRGKRSYLPSQLNRLHNVVLISGFFSQPAIVKDVADNLSRRQEHVSALRELLAGRDRVGDIHFDTNELTDFLDQLENCHSLDDERLPNPFIQLPHVIDNGTGKFPCVLDAYSSGDMVLSQFERMLAAYLDLDIEKAYQLSTTLEAESGVPLKFKQWIGREYREAQRFDDLLDSFFN